MSIYDLELIAGIFLPLLVGSYIFFFGWVLGGQSWLYRPFIFSVASGGLVCQGLLAIGFATGLRTPFLSLFRWSPVSNFEIDVAFRADFLSFIFALPVSVLSFFLIFYLLVRPPDPERILGIRRGKLYGLILFGQGAILGGLYSADLVVFFFWFETLGLILYLLAGPVIRGVASPKSSYQNYSASVVAGLLILAPLLVVISRNGGNSRYDQLAGASLDRLLFALISLGLLFKIAQFPFQVVMGGIKEVTGLVQALLGLAGTLPLAVYFLTRLKIIASDRGDFLMGSGWVYLLAGGLTSFFCGWLALKEGSFLARSAYLVGGSTGFVVMALGLNDWRAAFWQLIGLILGGTILFYTADQLEVEYAPAPPDPTNAALSIPIKRSFPFRVLLAVCYTTAIFGQVGLPFSPSYIPRWQTLIGLMESYRFIFALALTGLILMALAGVQSFILGLSGPRHTLESRKGGSRLALWIPLLLTFISISLTFAPTLMLQGLTYLNNPLFPGVTEDLPALLALPGALAGILFLATSLVALAFNWRYRKVRPAAIFNGGMLFGLEAEAEEKARRSHTRALLKVEEEDQDFGFEDEFFKVGLRQNLAPPPPKVEPRLSQADYFGPLKTSFGGAYSLVDTTTWGSFFSRILLFLLNRLRRVLEWLTERFYPALAAFLVLIFILFLTR